MLIPKHGCLKDIKASLEALGMKNHVSVGLISNVLNALNLSAGSNLKLCNHSIPIPADPLYFDKLAWGPQHLNLLQPVQTIQILLNPELMEQR